MRRRACPKRNPLDRRVRRRVRPRMRQRTCRTVRGSSRHPHERDDDRGKPSRWPRSTRLAASAKRDGAFVASAWDALASPRSRGVHGCGAAAHGFIRLGSWSLPRRTEGPGRVVRPAGYAHTFGRLFFREFCIRLLASRLRVEHDLVRHPEIHEVEIRRPLFITGLPRSGTTLLHRLLSQAPGAGAAVLGDARAFSSARGRDRPVRPADRSGSTGDPQPRGAGSTNPRRAFLRGRGA